MLIDTAQELAKQSTPRKGTETRLSFDVVPYCYGKQSTPRKGTETLLKLPMSLSQKKQSTPRKGTETPVYYSD